MKLWMSGEAEADVAEDLRVADLKIESEINRFLLGLEIPEPIDRWAFISIILSDTFISNYPEIFRRSLKRKTLEFRLQIPHAQFKAADKNDKIVLILDALERSVNLMAQLKVSASTQAMLHDVVAKARTELLSS